jgi:hypothetical protein
MHFMIVGLGHLANQRPYLDPGSGSILIQLLAAGLLAAGILLRASWGRILKLFGKEKAAKPKDEFDDEVDE